MHSLWDSNYITEVLPVLRYQNVILVSCILSLKVTGKRIQQWILTQLWPILQKQLDPLKFECDFGISEKIFFKMHIDSFKQRNHYLR